MVNSTKKVIFMIIIFAVAGAFCPVTAGVVFRDSIKGYDTSAGNRYIDLNTSLYISQQPGAWVPRVTDTSDLGTYGTTLPNQLVILGGGQASKYTTLAFDASNTDRYGQVFLRIGEKLLFVKLAFFNDANPIFADGPGWETNTVAEIFWRHDKIRTNRVGDSTGELFFDWDTANFHYVTLNYDLVAGTYELYVDTTLLADEMLLNGSTIRSMAIGSAWLATGLDCALDYWHWQTSNTNEFTSYGQEILGQCGDPGTVYKAGDVNKDCYVDFGDMAAMAIQWLNCTDPEKFECGQ